LHSAVIKEQGSQACDVAYFSLLTSDSSPQAP